MLEGGLLGSHSNNFIKTSVCRLVTLAYPSAEASLVSHVGKEEFIAALSDGRLQLEVMKREPQNVKAELSHTIKVEVFEQSLSRGIGFPTS